MPIDELEMHFMLKEQMHFPRGATERKCGISKRIGSYSSGKIAAGTEPRGTTQIQGGASFSNFKHTFLKLRNKIVIERRLNISLVYDALDELESFLLQDESVRELDRHSLPDNEK